MSANNTVRLSRFILDNMEPILHRWDNFASTIEPAALTMDARALRDHATQMLKKIAADMNTWQTAQEQLEKSEGHMENGPGDTPAETHAAARLVSGYSIEQLVSEYRALRASVLHLWDISPREKLATDVNDVTRFNEAIDQALTESVTRYAQMVRQSQNLFLAILGHDLRNPLGTVINAADVIRQVADIDGKHAVLATRIFNSGKRMSKLVNDLIDFTRTHLGSGLPITPKQTDAGRICLNIVDELRINYPGRQITFDADGQLDGMWDEGRIAQVFSNLIGNALQHGDADEPVAVRLHAEADEIVAQVTNKGTPIEPHRMQTIFDPLIRFAEQDAEDSQETSLGIGLYIARIVVHAHGGAITVASSSSDGTSFTVRLPRSPTFDVMPHLETVDRPI